MAKVKAVKWAIGADEPEDLQEFQSNDDIVRKHTNKRTKEVAWPGKGPFTFKVVQARIKPNKNGDDRIGVMLVLNEPKKSEAASWNGYVIWDGFNVTEQGAPFLKRWLRGLGLEWSDFIGKTKQDDQDPPHIVQIGRVKFESVKDVNLRSTVVIKPADDWNDDEHLEIGRYLPADEEVEDEPEDEEDADVEDFSDDEEDEDEEADESEDEDEDEDDDEEDEDDEDDEDEDEEEEEDDDEDAIEEMREELDGMKLPALRKRARRNDKKSEEDFESMKKKDLIGVILTQELNAPPF